jgi:hypothetical protein
MVAADSGKIGAKMRFWAEFLRDRGYVVLLVDSFRPRGLDEICAKRNALDSAKTPRSVRIGERAMMPAGRYCNTLIGSLGANR